MKLLVATTNMGKKAEFAKLMQGLPVDLTTLKEMGIQGDIEENGATYAENALLKARGYAAATGLLTLADDSGLEVDALGGDTGVLTARYAGEGATDAQRSTLLLRNLEGVPDECRTARFRCVIALAWPSEAGREERTELTEGVCEGRITHAPRGTYGFGYDPVFYLPEYGCTMAELPAEVKNRISHRARAAAAAIEILIRYQV
jgi:XTP/dITP diphosphohydrolase